MRIRSKLAVAGALALAIVGVLAAAATARTAAAPQNSTSPTITGTPKEGATETANEGTWTNTPTSFTYQWQRCGSGGGSCGDINGATSKTYTASSGDVGHTLRVVVTAVNADGKTPATSDATDVIGSANGPANTVKPSLSGSAVVGNTLQVSNGSWSPTPTSYSRQWQRCNTAGAACATIAGATGQTYGVRSADTGHRVRALVTAHTSSGSTTVATSASAVVTSSSSTVTTTTTTTTTTPAPSTKAPTISFLSLRRSGAKVTARFRLCDDQFGRIRVTERDNKNRVLSVARHWTFSLNAACAVYSRTWTPGRAFRTKGRYVVTLRATDAQGHLGLLRSRAIVYH